ncbi:N-acetylmuramoyl-L-alanine amidase [Nocardiopsis algeriensis]|uniref:N-acetylmuramoyl-L-alanine amidase n=1 Tax=Nocardiopsis algeriensis TaxID=1478215 RepID=A0A841IJU7_9ACTN|nr:N-acetylmuramoyl-L-alanine amidase [Nocardiopsis algeriensis]MBB6118332.1 N-acetylmuramoyl-L-alanine amidase [Nocardiopsis algeriensis]
MPDSAPPGHRSRAARALTSLPLVLLLASCSGSPGPAPGEDPTATLPLPGPDDGSSGTEERGEPGDAAPSTGPVGDGPLGGRVVVIDPGHNGGNAEAPSEINELVPAGQHEKACDTVGAQTASGYAEHEFNWEVSLLVREKLEADGATVVLTRQDNESVGPCIDERAGIGNEAGADASVSIHADGGPESGRGFHVILPGEVEGYTDDITDESRVLAEDLHREYLDGSGIPYADYLADGGFDERTDLGGLNMSDVPKVFLEMGNMRNAEDAALMEDPEWREQAASAVARGLAVYLLRN